MGNMIVSDKVHLDVGVTSYLFSHVKSQFSLWDETPGEGSFDNHIPLGGYVYRHIRGSSEKAFPCIHCVSSAFSSKQSR